MASIQEALAQAAQRYGQDPNTLIREAQIESAMNPNAHNASGAAGLLQFIPSTAKQYGLANPYDPIASADAGARLLRDNNEALKNALGRDPTGGEDYLAHQQGAGGAAALLEHPDAQAASIVGRDAVVQNGGTPDMTAGQFANLWTSRFGAQSPTGSAPSALPMAMASASDPAAVDPSAVAQQPSPDASTASNLNQAYPMLAAAMSSFGGGPITKAVMSTLPMMMAAGGKNPFGGFNAA